MKGTHTENHPESTYHSLCRFVCLSFKGIYIYIYVDNSDSGRNDIAEEIRTRLPVQSTDI